MPKLKFEVLLTEGLPTSLYRTPVPGGWLLVGFENDAFGGAKTSVTFYPDPHHSWNGGSVEFPKPPPQPHKREP